MASRAMMIREREVEVASSSHSRRCWLFVRLLTGELDVDMDPVVGDLWPLRLPVVDYEQHSVLGEQRDIIVDGTVVPIEIVCER